MKNLFKFGFLALAISLSVSACSSSKTTEAAVDSDSIKAADSAAMMAVDTNHIDSAKADTVIKKAK